MQGARFLYPHREAAPITEEYRIIEEEQEHDILMEEALNVGENITALANCDGLIWGITTKGLLDAVPHRNLLEYSLTVMEGMGLIAHTDLDDPIWDEYECGFDDNRERFRAANRMNPPWRALRDGCTSENRDD